MVSANRVLSASLNVSTIGELWGKPRLATAEMDVNKRHNPKSDASETINIFRAFFIMTFSFLRHFILDHD
jgi:hypothetical protein